MQTTQPLSAVDPRDLSQRAHENIDRLKSSAHDTVERAAAVATYAADRIGARGGELVAAKDQSIERVRSYVHLHPFAALGIALAAGYFASRLFGR
jgi:ElaB/YqjD/DUF883 family membrane-anchored ribosome-binding protein